MQVQVDKFIDPDAHFQWLRPLALRPSWGGFDPADSAGAARSGEPENPVR